ncbi:hypothetical protein AMTR_s00121p00045400 [Amborella trichopoda]|uniref:Uncharacterized protein n=1 Tax=Amborella trichopoda TaxID=13333 RepID=W1NRR7_AMBTC|nr:hypothetical protein AMTR_s00121p00045400 [Amborella trichopoda]
MTRRLVFLFLLIDVKPKDGFVSYEELEGWNVLSLLHSLLMSLPCLRTTTTIPNLRTGRPIGSRDPIALSTTLRRSIRFPKPRIPIQITISTSHIASTTLLTTSYTTCTSSRNTNPPPRPPTAA